MGVNVDTKCCTKNLKVYHNIIIIIIVVPGEETRKDRSSATRLILRNGIRGMQMINRNIGRDAKY